MSNISYLQSMLNRSPILSEDTALYKVVSELLLNTSRLGDGSNDRLVADPYQFVLDPFSGLYLQNTGQSGSAEFPFKVDQNGIIYERFRTTGLGTWIPYTPTWTASVAPAIGDGTLTGGYALIGKVCAFYITLVAGSTTTFGTGFWQFSLPLTAVTFSGNSSVPGGIASARDDSTTSRNNALAILNGATNFFLTTTATNALYGSTSPWTWATSDQLGIFGVYQIA